MSQDAELLKETDNLFNREYEQELATWARRRFRNFCIVMFVFLGLGLLFFLIFSFANYVKKRTNNQTNLSLFKK